MRASSEDHQAQLTFTKIKHNLPFPSLPPQKYGLYHYSLQSRQVQRLSHTSSSKLHPNSFLFPRFPAPSLAGRGDSHGSGRDGAGGLTDDAALEREGGDLTLNPPSEEAAFQRKHVLPGSVCSNSPLGTSLVHRAKSPEHQFVQLEPRWGTGAGQGGRGGLCSPRVRQRGGGGRTGPLSRRGVSPRCSSVPGVRFSQRFTTARAESSCTATSLKRKNINDKINKKKKSTPPIKIRMKDVSSGLGPVQNPLKT